MLDPGLRRDDEGREDGVGDRLIACLANRVLAIIQVTVV
jgi:hypothetical protein